MSSTFIVIFVSVLFPTHAGVSYLAAEPLSFNNAETYCNAHCNSNLLSLHSQTQYDTILSLLASSSTSTNIHTAWIGLTDEQNEGIFLWTDASNVTYTAFDPSPPTLNTSSNCVQINTLTQHWQVTHCDTKQPFLCNSSCTTSTEDEHVQQDTTTSFQSILFQYLWLIISGFAILIIVCICCFFVCFHRKKQYKKAMTDKDIDKYRTHVQHASASKISANKRTHSAATDPVSVSASQANHFQFHGQMQMYQHNDMEVPSNPNISPDANAISLTDQRYIDAMLKPSYNAKQSTTLADLVVDVEDGSLGDIYRKESLFTSTATESGTGTAVKSLQEPGANASGSMLVTHGSAMKIRVPAGYDADRTSPRQEMMDAARAGGASSRKHVQTQLNIMVTSPAGKSREYGKDAGNKKQAGRKMNGAVSTSDDRTVGHRRIADGNGNVTQMDSRRSSSKIKMDTV